MSDILDMGPTLWKAHVKAVTGNDTLAEQVFRLAGEYARFRGLAHDFETALKASRERLHRYEPPPPPSQPRSYRAPPESDG